MKVNKIYYSSYFARTFQCLPKSIRKKALKEEKKFRENCFHEQLQTRHLQQVTPGYWIFSIDQSYRILFEFWRDSGTVGFIDVADHSIYRQSND